MDAMQKQQYDCYSPKIPTEPEKKNWGNVDIELRLDGQFPCPKTGRKVH